MMRLSPRTVFVFLSGSALAFLGAGLLLGEWFRLQPCYLCNFQRFLYLLLAFFALCGVLIPGWRRFWSVLTGLTALAGVITAGQQSWMQYAPQLVTECGFGEPTLVEQIVNWLSLKWPSMFMVTGFCTSKEWLFFGFSLANLSIVCFLTLLCVSAWQGMRRIRRRR